MFGQHALFGGCFALFFLGGGGGGDLFLFFGVFFCFSLFLFGGGGWVCLLQRGPFPGVLQGFC